MASIRQYQRRAIESLAARIPKPVHALESIYDLRPVLSLNFRLRGGNPLRVLGISNGVGTCSDIHGMNVLVLSADSRSKSEQVETTLEEAQNCAYAVLLRRAAGEETTNGNFDPARAIFCVELLRITDISVSYTDMEPIGPRAYYAATIC